MGGKDGVNKDVKREEKRKQKGGREEANKNVNNQQRCFDDELR